MPHSVYITDPLCKARMRFGNYLSLLFVSIALACFGMGWRHISVANEKLAHIDGVVSVIHEDVQDIRDALKCPPIPPPPTKIVENGN